MKPSFEVQLKIEKGIDRVFQAVVDPKDLTSYFVKTSSGPLEEGATVMWEFAEAAGQHPVKVRQIIKNERIVFEWEGGEGYDTTVEMVFKALEDEATMVQIKETGWKETPEGLKQSYRNCGGWMHMMCAMKAHLLHGVNLRASCS